MKSWYRQHDSTLYIYLKHFKSVNSFAMVKNIISVNHGKKCVNLGVLYTQITLIFKKNFKKLGAFILFDHMTKYSHNA